MAARIHAQVLSVPPEWPMDSPRQDLVPYHDPDYAYQIGHEEGSSSGFEPTVATGSAHDRGPRPYFVCMRHHARWRHPFDFADHDHDRAYDHGPGRHHDDQGDNHHRCPHHHG